MDNLNPTGYPQVVEEVVNGLTQRTYAYGFQRIDENQGINNTWTPSFYGYDGMGSVRQLSNAAGTITDTYEYDAFGNKIGSTGTTPNNYLYRGERVPHSWRSFIATWVGLQTSSPKPKTPANLLVKSKSRLNH